MNVKALKDKILQLAIQGKLVEQDENDEPALVLLNRIKEEKEKLIKEKKIKKEKPLPEIMEEEKSFELPNGWEWVRLGEISEYIQRGKSPKYSNVEKYPVIAQKCVQWSGVSLEKALFIEPDSITKYGEERFLVHGDLLWNSTGTGSCGRIGKFTDSIRNGFDKIVADSHVTVIRCFKKYINYEYLFIWLSSPEVQSVIESKASGSTNQIELSTVTIKNYLISLPPLEEQERIVKKVNELFSLVEELNNNRQELLQNIVNSRNKILQLAIQGKLVEQKEDDEPVINLLNMVSKSWDVNKIVDDEKIFDIPSGWEWVKLKDICEKFKYGSSAKSKESGDVPVLRMGNIQGGKIDWKNLVYTSDEVEINKYDLVKGDLLFNRTNSPELVGKTAIYKGEHTAIYAGYLIRVRTLEGIDSEYINLFMNSQTAKDRCREVKTDGVSQSNINAEKLGDFNIPLPPTNEQKRIVEKVNIIMDYLDALEKEIES